MRKLGIKIAEIFKAHKNIAKTVNNGQTDRFLDILKEKADRTTLTLSLAELISHLYAFYQKPVVVLIDEYDSPVIEAYQNGYHEEMIDFMREWFGGGPKHVEGQSIFRAIITGIRRITRESIFSDLNNLKVCSILTPSSFVDKFGFTKPEVKKVLADVQLSDKSSDVQEWYNGYKFGNTVTVYNPWSVVNLYSTCWTAVA